MKYILLDTNILIYREGEKELNNEIQTLSRLLMDSTEYHLCVHPLTIDELSKHKNQSQKEVIQSKVSTYKILDQPPKPSLEFNMILNQNNSHDYIDNNLLYAVYKNCVSYLITNDKGILKKSKKINIENRVLSISQAINIFSVNDPIIQKAPPFVCEEYLYNVDTTDSFFDSLRNDYYQFDNWIEKKKLEHIKAWLTYTEDKKVGAFLMLKIENEFEIYNDFIKPFKNGKRLKISTFKVQDNGKLIGEIFIKIIFDTAIKNNLNEIYVTIFDKQEKLIDLFKEYGFVLYTYKHTKRNDESVANEGVYVRYIKEDITNYPIIKFYNQNTYIIPIQDQYAHMLFPDVFENNQLSINDLNGTSTYSNCIKKVYISRSKISKLKKDDILIFYASQVTKAIICVGIIDDVFISNEESYQVFKNIVSRRTVYSDEYLKKAFQDGYLVIMFKYFVNLENHIPLDIAIHNGIIKSAPQSIQRVNNENLKKIVKLSGSERQIKI